MSDHHPLLNPGFHDINVEDLEKHFVEPFNDSSRREVLTEKLIYFITRLKELGIDLEIWIAGSYTNDKTSPSDVDLVVFIEQKDVNALSKDKKRVFSNLFGNPRLMKIRYNLDIFFAPKDQESDDYWKGTFGFSRHGNTPKGISRICLKGDICE